MLEALVDTRCLLQLRNGTQIVANLEVLESTPRLYGACGLAWDRNGLRFGPNQVSDLDVLLAWPENHFSLLTYGNPMDLQSQNPQSRLIQTLEDTIAALTAALNDAKQDQEDPAEPC